MVDQPKIYEACREISECVVLHSAFKNALEGLRSIVTQASVSGLPHGATVVGESGTGKTTLMKAMLQHVPSVDLLGEQPSALCLSAQSCPTIGDLLGKLLRDLGFPPAVRGNRLSELSLSLTVALQSRRIKVLFIQDFQHLSRGSRDKSAASITDWLKQLIEDAGVVLILFGTPELGELSALNAQLHSRTPARYHLPAFKRDDQWTGLLQGIAEHGKALDWKVIHEKYERELHQVCGGLLRPLKQMLCAAASVHVRLGDKEISAQAFSQAHKMVFGTESVVPNPFERRMR